MFPPHGVHNGFVSRLADGAPDGVSDRPALVTEAGTVSHAELRRRVLAAAGRLGPERRLVLLAGRNHPEETDPPSTLFRRPSEWRLQ